MLSKRQGAYVYSGRVDLLAVASIFSAYVAEHVVETAASTVLRYALEDYAKILIKNGKARKFEDFDEANQFLREIGVKKQLRNTRNYRKRHIADYADADIVVPDEVLPAEGHDVEEMPEISEPGVLSVEEVLKKLNEIEGKNHDKS